MLSCSTLNVDHRELIQLQDIVKIYYSGGQLVTAIKLINASFKEGEIVAIVGPSGSGKSTLLNIIVGLEKPNRGSVKVGDVETTMMTDDDLTIFRRKSFGYIPQTKYLLPYMTVSQNVEVPLLFSGSSKEGKDERIMDTLRRVRISHLAHRRADSVSAGERQRVAIARALVSEPRILVADEPTSDLDWETGRGIMDLMVSMAKNKGQTVIVTTHDMELIQKCDRALKIRDGRIESIEIVAKQASS